MHLRVQVLWSSQGRSPCSISATSFSQPVQFLHQMHNDVLGDFLQADYASDLSLSDAAIVMDQYVNSFLDSVTGCCHKGVQVLDCPTNQKFLPHHLYTCYPTNSKCSYQQRHHTQIPFFGEFQLVGHLQQLRSEDRRSFNSSGTAPAQGSILRWTTQQPFTITTYH